MSVVSFWTCIGNITISVLLVVTYTDGFRFFGEHYSESAIQGWISSKEGSSSLVRCKQQLSFLCCSVSFVCGVYQLPSI